MIDRPAEMSETDYVSQADMQVPNRAPNQVPSAYAPPEAAMQVRDSEHEKRKHSRDPLLANISCESSGEARPSKAHQC